MNEPVEIDSGLVADDHKALLQVIYFGALISSALSFIPLLNLLMILVWIGLLITAYLKKKEVDPASRSHLENFITVFWVGLLGVVIAFVLGVLVLPLGIMVGIVVLIWELYRLIKGTLRMMANKAYN